MALKTVKGLWLGLVRSILKTEGRRSKVFGFRVESREGVCGGVTRTTFSHIVLTIRPLQTFAYNFARNERPKHLIINARQNSKFFLFLYSIGIRK